MKASATFKLVNLLQPAIPREQAEEFVKTLAEESIEDGKNYLTKDDMITIINKIDSKGNWVVGFIAVMLSLAVAIIKLT